tara:strand:- start:64 stop:429 length:366 start_codon:yes stop_codon:yes gene_type:complete
MPTNKKRVGFIPREEVMIILKKLSEEENLSQSKIVSILVEEALEKREIFNKKKGISKFVKNKCKSKFPEDINSISEISNDSLNYNQIDSEEKFKYPIDNQDMYNLFMQFLKFQEMMNRSNN